MDKFNIKIISLEEHRGHESVEHYWVGRSEEERVSAVEILRRQFGKLKPGTGYGSSQRLRRVLRIDVITTIDGVSFEDAWARRVESRYGDEAVHFISKQDLIANKRATGRKQDLLDLDALLGT